MQGLYDATVTEAQTPRRTRLRAQQRRESILAVAMEVFAETGYHSAKVSTVAARLGVSEPVIFQNFGSKAALFAAVVDHAATLLCTAVDHLTEHVESVADLLTTMLAPDHVAAAHAPGSLGVLFADAAGLTTEPDIQAAASRARQRFAAALTRLLEHGQHTGHIRPDLNPIAGAWWIISLLATQRLRATDTPDYPTVETHLAELTLHTMLNEPHRDDDNPNAAHDL